MIFNQCPICGRYMIPNMSETSGWYQCVCGYDSRSYVYTYTNHSSDFGYGEKERRTTRLIDADLMKNSIESSDTDENILISPQELIATLIRWIDNRPTVDAVEVVRCKDCKWYDNIGCALIIVDEEDRPKPDDYCSYGERRAEE